MAMPFARRTRIVATLGPATDPVLAPLLSAGVDVVRFNLSHGSWEEHRERMRAVSHEARRQGRHVGIMVDTRGPEVRIGPVAGDRITLVEGSSVTLVPTADDDGPHTGDATQLAVNHPGLARDVPDGAVVLLDDGRLRLVVTSHTAAGLCCRVEAGGSLSGHKKVNVPGVPLSVPYLGTDDRASLAHLAEGGALFDMVAASFVSRASDLLLLRQFLDSLHTPVPLIAKIESQAGVDNLDAILQACDGVMVARGDLGVEVPVEEVPLIQKRMIALARRYGQPVITATQMLESMTEGDRPTRAEATDVANAILDGTDAVMLSEETALGRHPVRAVAMMARIAEATERSPEFQRLLRAALPDVEATVTGTLSGVACTVAETLRARAIVTPTVSGFTARMVARHRPPTPVIAVTRREAIARQLSLLWGTTIVVDDSPQPASNDSELFQRAAWLATEAGHLDDGDIIVLTGGVPRGVSGSTNTLRVATIGQVLAAGQGIGREPATGPVYLWAPERTDANIPPGAVVVAASLDAVSPAFLAAAVALVVEEPGRHGPVLVAAIHLGIPALVGAEGARERLTPNQLVTVDPIAGVVHATRPKDAGPRRGRE